MSASDATHHPKRAVYYIVAHVRFPVQLTENLNGRHWTPCTEAQATEFCSPERACEAALQHGLKLEEIAFQRRIA